jgi:serine/threonine-protein kinase RsbW
MSRRFERLTLPANLGSLPALREFALAGANQAGLPAAERDKLDLVLEELLVNVARYAYQPGTGDVELAYAVQGPGKLLVRISDKGFIFNPLHMLDPALPDGLEQREIGGLGVFLVKQLAGSVQYRREKGRNIVSFRLP